MARNALENDRLKAAAIVMAVAAGAGIVYFLDPSTSSVYPACLFHTLTGLHCPGCGTLRASHQLLHLDLLAAIRFNPLTVFVIPFLGYAFFSQISVGIRGRPLPRAAVPAAWIWTLLAVILAFWFLRNIPVYPFSLLAPSG